MEQRANICRGEGLALVEGGVAAAARSPVPRPATACRIVRGVVRLMSSLDHRSLTEFLLPDGRRADVAAVDARGGFAIVEVKSSVADFRSDGKWPAYRSYCDAFYFGVDPAFPLELLPAEAGVIVTDGFEAAMLRAAPALPLRPGRRRALLLRFARTAAARLAVLADP